jgi:hypothetical protein
MAKVINNNCNGDGPHRGSQVRLLPTGGGGNAILCRACFRREMAYRYDRNREVKGSFDIPVWDSLKVYGDADEV